MAVEQPLKGGTNKVYSVINNFNKGIDKKTADDVSVETIIDRIVGAIQTP